MLDRRVRLAGLRCIEAVVNKIATSGIVASPLAPVQKPKALSPPPTATETVPKVVTPPQT